MNIKYYDMVIVGAGIVGLSLAASFRNSNLKVALVDRKNILLNKLHNNSDVVALNRASRNVLKNIGVNKDFIESSWSPYSNMFITNQDYTSKINFDTDKILDVSLGYIVNKIELEKELTLVVEKSSNIDIFEEKENKSILNRDKEVWLSFESGEYLVSKLIVGADGGNSWVRGQLKIPTVEQDYDQFALTCDVLVEHSHNNTASQFFLSTGPLALLPKSNPKSYSIVWTLTPELARSYENLSKDEFHKKLLSASNGFVGKILGSTNIRIRPLKMICAQQFIKDNAVLVGDAAHVFHPLAGLGVNLGIQDIASLNEVINQCIEQGTAINDAKHLRHFERWRKSEAIKLISMLKVINDIFKGKNKIVNFFTKAGLFLIDNNSFIKNFFVKKALQVDFKPPKLSKKSE